MGVALLEPIPHARLRLRALAISTDWDEHSPEPLLEASAARHGAGRPLRPLLEPAVAVAGARVAGLAAVLRLHHDAAGTGPHASLALLCALGPTRPSRLHAIHRTLLLVALPLLRKARARNAKLVVGYDNVAGQRLSASASEGVILVRACVVARHGALAGDPR